MVLSKFENFNIVAKTIEELFLCTEKSEIEKVFFDNQIIDTNDKIGLLKNCMGINKTFGIEELTNLEDEYDFEIAVFFRRVSYT
jgi:hypothetical protein